MVFVDLVASRRKHFCSLCLNGFFTRETYCSIHYILSYVMRTSLHPNGLLIGGFIATLLLLCSCNSELPSDPDPHGEESGSSDVESIKMTPDQAIAYVKLFGEEMTVASTPENKLRAADLDRQIGLVDYYVENNDTLLYVVNYKDEKGYVLLSSNNGGFPIIAHSDAGELRFSDIR